MWLHREIQLVEIARRLERTIDRSKSEGSVPQEILVVLEELRVVIATMMRELRADRGDVPRTATEPATW